MHIISDLNQLFKMKANVLRVGDVALCCPETSGLMRSTTFFYHKTVCGARNPAYCKYAVISCSAEELQVSINSCLIFY